MSALHADRDELFAAVEATVNLVEQDDLWYPDLTVALAVPTARLAEVFDGQDREGPLDDLIAAAYAVLRATAGHRATPRLASVLTRLANALRRFTDL